jgi:serine/threonine protein kinase
MEFCGAGSLSDLMAICDVTLSEDQIAGVMQQCIEGLAYLHKTKKIHRDIKSGNILLTHAGECKLADFGVSAELTNTLAKRVTLIGTPYFMAPEVLEQSQYDAKADIWSLAITAYELAVGQPPHADVHPMRAIFLIPNSEPPKLPEPHRYSRDFNDFLAVCLKKNPSERPSAVELLKHPFIKKAKSKQVILALLDSSRDAIDEYRAMEAAEQQAANENDPNFVPTRDDGTMVQRQTATGTMVGPSGTWASHDGTVVANAAMLSQSMASDQFATMVSTKQPNMATMVNNNNMSTMVSTGGDYATMVARQDNGHFGTVKLHRKGNADTVALITPPKAAPAAAEVVHTAKGASLFSSITVNSGVEDIERVRVELNRLYESDLKAINDFYMKKQETLRKMLEMKKKAK